MLVRECMKQWGNLLERLEFKRTFKYLKDRNVEFPEEPLKYFSSNSIAPIERKRS